VCVCGGGGEQNQLWGLCCCTQRQGLCAGCVLLIPRERLSRGSSTYLLGENASQASQPLGSVGQPLTWFAVATACRCLSRQQGFVHRTRHHTGAAAAPGRTRCTSLQTATQAVADGVRIKAPKIPALPPTRNSSLTRR
jgi:hypothetical protein